MKYKGYEAVVAFDEEDRLFIGRVVNTRDVIAFDGASVEELEQSFHHVIDEYLEDCQITGKTPEKPFSGHFNLRISPALHRQAATQAQKEGVSLNTLVEQALQKRISVKAVKGIRSVEVDRSSKVTSADSRSASKKK